MTGPEDGGASQQRRVAPAGHVRLANASALIRAARRFGTPVYVVDAAALECAAADVEAAFGTGWIRQYSLKANDLPALAARLHRRSQLVIARCV